MATTFYSKQEDGGVFFRSERRPGEVRIPNYVYDIWMPLLGACALGVYATYCRLEMSGAVKKITIASLAKAFRIGKDRLRKINSRLEECGFIRLNKPAGSARLMHWTTEIIVLDPPMHISQELLDKYAPPSGYEILTPWLAEPPEDPDRSSGEPESAVVGGPESVPPEDPDPHSNIESLDILQPLSVEKKAAEKSAAKKAKKTTGQVLARLYGTGSDEERDDPPTELEKLIQHSFGMSGKRMSKGQRKRLTEPVLVGNSAQPGRLKKLPGPADLYDSDPKFAEYVAEGIAWASGPESFGSKPMTLAARRNACIGWIRNYEREGTGWLDFKKGGKHGKGRTHKAERGTSETAEKDWREDRPVWEWFGKSKKAARSEPVGVS